MKIILDENLDHRLRNSLGPHSVFTVRYLGWDGIKNGKLLEAAEREQFDILITGDKSLAYEQNLPSRQIAVIALSAIEWRILKPHLDRIRAAIENSVPGAYTVVDCGTFRRV